MRKYLVIILVVIGALSIFPLNESQAEETYGYDVDSFCLDSDPFGGNCALCHNVSNFQQITTPMQEYKSSNLCYFCSADSNCIGPVCLDGDGDGFFASDGCGTAVDCNDNDPNINPGLAEDCSDTKDNDCNGLIDMQDGACGEINCTDTDADGFSVEGNLCGPMDCNDNDPDIYPGAVDICNDGIDQDCSGKDRTRGNDCNTAGIQPKGKGKKHSDRRDNDENRWKGRDNGGHRKKHDDEAHRENHDDNRPRHRRDR